MFSFLSDFFQKKSIDCFAPVPLEACRVIRPYLLEREQIAHGTVIMLAIPYFSKACTEANRNVSAYAVSRDYHVFFNELFHELLPLLHQAFPTNRFAGFADHSPIAEVEAAAAAVLGVIGKNQLLLTEKYSSYVFLGELITDADIPCQAKEIAHCSNCGACIRHCPMERLGTCLSALTQKKGSLTEAETKGILSYGSAWGCDICQEVCPYTERALQCGTIYSPIPYFSEDTLPTVSLETLSRMTDEEFACRAYAWRGRAVIQRNLHLLEMQNDLKGEALCCD